MDPTFARVLADTHLAAPPPMRHGRAQRPRGDRWRPRLAAVMRRLADRIDAPVLRPQPCR